MISIIVPIYNAECYLKRCLDSILSQSYTNFELILVDDGSKDSSYEICCSYASKDDRVCVLRKKNEGAGIARNSALKIAKGEYIGFVDSDDYIHPNMYKYMYLGAVENNADIVQCGYNKVRDNGSIVNHSFYSNRLLNGGKECFEEYCKQLNIDNYSPCKLFKREILQDVWFGDFCYSEDTYFIVKAFFNCNHLLVIKDRLYNYVQTENSTCRRPFNLQVQDTVKVGKILYDCCQSKYPEYSFYFARYIITWSRTCCIGFTLGNFKNKHVFIQQYVEYFNLFYSRARIYFPCNLKESLLFLFRISPYSYMLLLKCYRGIFK